jgi:hypothetical protein
VVALPLHANKIVRVIAERFPELETLAPEEQLALAAELTRKAARMGGIPDLTERSVAVLEERLDHFLANPESGISWEELRMQWPSE